MYSQYDYQLWENTDVLKSYCGLDARDIGKNREHSDDDEAMKELGRFEPPISLQPNQDSHRNISHHSISNVHFTVAMVVLVHLESPISEWWSVAVIIQLSVERAPFDDDGFFKKRHQSQHIRGRTLPFIKRACTGQPVAFFLLVSSF